MTVWEAAWLGVVEGVTEYLPVSSTGHLVLASHLMHLDDDGAKSFDIVIQFGAILAVLVHFRVLLLKHARGLVARSPASIQLATALVLGFLPSAVLGLLARKAIKAALFAPRPIAIAWIAGGVVMLAMELRRARVGSGGIADLETVTPKQGVLVGLAQCFALIPGVSRSMSTMVAGELTGLSLATAAEFSFLLGLMTLSVASGYEGLKEHKALALVGAAPIVVGLVVSFFVAWAVVAGFLAYLKRRGLTPFAIYRIILGIVVLASPALMGG
jgi:undecaprenyl-diphosphatase